MNENDIDIYCTWWLKPCTTWIYKTIYFTPKEWGYAKALNCLSGSTISNWLIWTIHSAKLTWPTWPLKNGTCATTTFLSGRPAYLQGGQLLILLRHEFFLLNKFIPANKHRHRTVVDIYISFGEGCAFQTPKKSPKIWCATKIHPGFVGPKKTPFFPWRNSLPSMGKAVLWPDGTRTSSKELPKDRMGPKFLASGWAVEISSPGDSSRDLFIP